MMTIATERERAAIFATNPMVAGFLSTMLQDAQYSENDFACEQGRDALDTGTIYDCPDATFRAVIAECDAFMVALRAAAAATHDQSEVLSHLEGFDVDRVDLKALGSDLYLERAGHGAGFQDRDIWHDDPATNRGIGDALSLLVEARSLETYLGDDGALYIVGRESVS